MVTQGKPFFVGVNLPWLSYGCDFGANAWQPDGGLGSDARTANLDDVLSTLALHGVRVVRWFLFCDGRSGLRLDPDGAAIGLDEFCLRDLDVAVETADRHGLEILFTLFDFLWFRPREVVNGVALFGRRTALSWPRRRAQLIEHVVCPVLRRYGRADTIAGWDLLNEPEWATLGQSHPNPATSVRPSTMRAILSDLAQAVHAEARQPATVGLASSAGLRLVRGLDLDMLQVHWYGKGADRDGLYNPAGQEAPVLLGEFPTKGCARTPQSLLEAARASSYAGALAWSALADDAYSDLNAFLLALGVDTPRS